jgi:YVTN family beta-propeller protein
VRVTSFAIFLTTAAWSSSLPAAPVACVAVTVPAGGKVVFVDPDRETVVGDIAVGGHPKGMALSHDRRQLFVAVAGAPKVSGVAPRAMPADATAQPGLAIINVAARKLERKLAVGSSPFAVALARDGRTAYVTDNVRNELLRIDVRSGTVKAKATVGKAPQGLALRPDGKIVYVASHDTNEIYAIDAKTLALLQRIDAGSGPGAPVFARDGELAFAPDEGSSAVSVLDAQRHTMKSTVGLSLPEAAERPALQSAVLSPDGKRLYVTTGAGGSVVIVGVGDQAASGRIDGVGGFPRGIAMSADGHKLYTANSASNDVAVIDVASAKVEKRSKVPGAPWDIAVVLTR